MNRHLASIFVSVGFLLIFLSLVGFIPHSSVDYDVTSTIFIIGALFIAIAFFIKRTSGEKRGETTTMKKGSSKKKR